MPESALLGMDIGSTNIRMVLGNSDGFVTEPVNSDTTQNWSSEGLARTVMRELENYPNYEIEAAGIGVAGLVDTQSKKMLKSTQTKEISFEELENKLEAPLSIENDANVAAIGEKYYGRGEDIDNLVTVTIGSGVGAGIFYSGQLLGSQTDRGNPEPGFTIIEDGKTWHEICGGNEIPDYINQRLAEKEKSQSMPDIESAKELFTRAEYEETAEEYVDHLAELNAIGITNILNAYSPDLLTVTGSVALENPGFMEKVFQRVRESDYTKANSVPEMYLSELGDSLGLYGALALADSDMEFDC